MYEVLTVCACVAAGLVLLFVLAWGVGAFIAAGMYDEEDKRGKGA